jgi:hypothetical protein
MFENAEYYVQLQAKRHELLMPEQKADFKIDRSFLSGLSENDFHTAYTELFNLIKGFYKDAEERPEEMGLPLYSLEEYRTLGKEARESEFSLLWFSTVLFALGTAGDIIEKKLVVNADKFKDALCSHKHKKLSIQFTYLIRHGFTITEWNGKNLNAKITVFTVQYERNPDIFIVLKAAARKIYSIEKNSTPPQYFDFHRITQFPHFLPELFQEETPMMRDYMDDYFSAVLEREEERQFFRSIINFFREQGLEISYSGDLLKNRLYDKNGKDTLNHIEYTDYRYGKENESGLLLRLKLNNINSYIDYIESLPAEVKESFQNVRCGHCTETCNRRICYELDGERKESCSCFSFLFRNTSNTYLPYYKELFLRERQAETRRR